MSEGAGGADLLPRFGAFLRWWGDELASLLPEFARSRLRARRAAIDCVLLSDGRMAVSVVASTQEAETTGPDALADRLAELAAVAPARTVRLSVPRDLCLIRMVELPTAALLHAGPILRHEIEALLPARPEDILSDWYVETEDRKARRLYLRQVALLRPRIAEAEAAIERAGLRLTRITVGESEGRPIPVDLLQDRRPTLRAHIAALSPGARALYAFAIALLLLAATFAAGRPERTLEAIEAARAAHGRPSPEALSAGVVADFLDEAAERPSASRLLDDIGRQLPTDAYVSSLSLAGDRLILGVSGPGRAGASAALSQVGAFGTASVVANNEAETVLLLPLAPVRRAAP